MLSSSCSIFIIKLLTYVRTYIENTTADTDTTALFHCYFPTGDLCVDTFPLSCAFVIFLLLLFLIRFLVLFWHWELKSPLALKSCKICNLRAYTSARTLCQPRPVVMATTLGQHLCIREVQCPAPFYSKALCVGSNEQDI